MAQFDVYQNLNPNTSKTIPYLLDVQADLFNNLSTRVVVPLVLSSKFGNPAKTLNPQFKIDNKTVIMSTAELAGIPANLLSKKITSLNEYRQKIITALDFLIVGF